jgi:hypothetical protein
MQLCSKKLIFFVGNDPDNLASGNPEGKSYLSKIGVAPGQPVPGTIGKAKKFKSLL